ncbi:hypothetical protein Hamer_G005871, partial [Homarus americanus]
MKEMRGCRNTDAHPCCHKESSSSRHTAGGRLSAGLPHCLVILGYSGGAKTCVIFDWYDGINAKDHERQRRAGEGSTAYQLSLNSSLAGRDAIMKNKDNKQQLSELLCTLDFGSNIERVSRADNVVRHGEADISLIRYMLLATSAGDRTVRILSDDIYVFVLLVYWCWKAGVSCCVLMENWNGSVFNINVVVAKLGEKCKIILRMHTLSGCDTVSYPNGKGKLSALKVLTQTDIVGLL